MFLPNGALLAFDKFSTNMVRVAVLGGVAWLAFAPVSFGQDLLYPFDISTGLTLRGGYEKKDGVGQSFMEAVPEITVTRTDEDFTLSGSASAALDKYEAEQARIRSLNLGGTVSYQFTHRTKLDAGLSYGRTIPRLNSDDVPKDATAAALSQEFGANATLSHQLSKTAFELRGSVARAFKGAAKLNDGSVVDNGDQNNWAYKVGGRVSRELTPTVSAFVDMNVTRSIYDQASATLSAKRDGWTFDNRVGLNATIKDRLSGEISIGQLRRTYDNANLNSVLTTSYGAALTYKIGHNAELKVSADTALSPTTEPGGADKITDKISFSFTQQVNNRFGYALNADFGRDHYQGSARTADRFGVGLDRKSVV